MKILFISLGCDKNLVDTEKMITALVAKGHTITDDENDADGCIINTCSFILDAKEESIDNILRIGELRRNGSIKALIVTGCLSQRYSEDLLEEMPEVDAFLGNFACDRICECLDRVLAGERFIYSPDINSPLVPMERKMVTTGGHYAYLKIAEGCEKKCTYCVIPSIRGKYRSVPMEELVSEAEYLVREIGVKELILVAQETTLYGVDLYGKKCLSDLLKRLCEIDGLVWIRVLYCYPEEIDEELAETMAKEDKICKYIDIPIQHASDRILHKMGRRTDKAELISKIQMLRDKMPNICIRTTLIAGFPGETDEDFDELMSFVDGIEFDRLGCFAYSMEEGTPAALMPDQVPEEIKEQRVEDVMLLQQEIAFEKAGRRIGEKMLVMIEGKLPDEDAYIGRTYMDAPGVDGFVFVNTNRTLVTGDFAYVIVTGSNEYDLIGELADEHC